MEIEYSNRRLKAQLTTPLELKKTYGSIAQKVNLRLQQMISSPTLTVLQSIPGAKCHQLKGNMVGKWAVEVSANYRMIFELDHDPIPKNPNNSIDTNLITKIKILSVEDYH